MVLLVVCFSIVTPQVFAADVEESLTFPITSFEVEGNHLLDSATVDIVLAPFVGDNKSFATVQEALEALEGAYAKIGYSTVLVTLPEQRLQEGLVRFKVVEGRVARIEVDKKRYFDEENIVFSLPSLKVGETPNIDEMSANLAEVGRSPAKRLNVVFKPGEEEGDVVANVKVSEKNPLRWAATLDTTGNHRTGLFRAGIAFQNSNLFNLDHVLTMQAVTSPDQHHRDVKIGAISYHIPFYSLDSSLDAIVGYSSVNSGEVGTTVGNFSISGAGNVYELHYNQNLKKMGDWEPKVSVGYAYRLFKTNVVIVGSVQNLVPRVTIHPLDLTLSLSKSTEPYFFNGYFSFVQNIPYGSHGETDDFVQQGLRPHSRASYFLMRYGVDYSYLFKSGWQARAKFSGQFTRDLLMAGEQFGIGGHDSIRGLDERAFSNDTGNQVTFEAYTPEFGKYVTDYLTFLPENFKVRALTFWDAGSVKRNHPEVFENQGSHVQSSGLGLRMAFGENVDFRIDWARIGSPNDAIGHHTKTHAQLSWTF
ncbi:MAG: ShlB/FhaC/HecB family hemolysin secretion/activation protein [Methylophilaceae bacterium]